MNENDYTEQYRGIIMVRKGKEKDEDVWFATVGRQIVSDRVYKTKKELIEAYRDWETDRKSTRLNSSHITRSRMPSSA